MKIFKLVGCLAMLVVALCFWSNNSQAKEVVIGFTGPLSGPAAEYGLNCVNGLDMAVKVINERGGIKVKGETYEMKLVKYDDQMDPTKAVTNSRRMQEQDHAIAIFQDITASDYPMMNVNTEKGHEFIVMAYTSSPALPKKGNPLTITIPPTFSIYAEIEPNGPLPRVIRKPALS